MSNLNNWIEELVRQTTGQQAMGNQANSQAFGGLNNASNLGGLGGMLGSVLGGNQGGLGGIIGSVLGMGNRTGGLGAGLGNAMGRQAQGGFGNKSQLLFILIPFVLNWVQQQGGFKAALDKFSRAGMGPQVNSWVSNDTNQPVEPNQLASVIPPEQVQQLAQQTNTSPDEIYSSLAGLLPQMVNAITPNGQMHGNGSRNQIEQVMNAFKALA